MKGYSGKPRQCIFSNVVCHRKKHSSAFFRKPLNSSIPKKGHKLNPCWTNNAARKRTHKFLCNHLTCTDRLTQSTRPGETNLKSHVGTLRLEGRQTGTAVTPSGSFACERPVNLFFRFLQLGTGLEILHPLAQIRPWSERGAHRREESLMRFST